MRGTKRRDGPKKEGEEPSRGIGERLASHSEEFGESVAAMATATGMPSAEH